MRQGLLVRILLGMFDELLLDDVTLQRFRIRSDARFQGDQLFVDASHDLFPRFSTEERDKFHKQGKSKDRQSEIDRERQSDRKARKNRQAKRDTRRQDIVREVKRDKLRQRHNLRHIQVETSGKQRQKNRQL